MLDWTDVTADYSDEATVEGGFNENKDLYAIWKPNKYRVTLDRQGGTTGSTSVEATYDAAMPSATMPTKTGYLFNGYFKGTAGTGTKYYNVNGSSAHIWDIPNDDILYAYWKPKQCTLVFNLNSGSGSVPSGKIATYDAAMPDYGYGAPSRTGYAFDGYFYPSASSGTQYYTSGLASARNWDVDTTTATTLYAKWIPNTYYVAFNKNSTAATGEMFNQTFTYDVAQNLT